jgi:sugar/nucleoside kinase (ribokinase family)
MTPEFLTIGHVTRDLHANNSYTLGGTVTFAALTAYRLGLAAAIVTCTDPQLITELPTHLPNISLHVRPSNETTTFVNSYVEGFRTQYLRARSANIEAPDIPKNWQNTPIVLLGPLAQELAPDLVQTFPRQQGRIIAATPQGWLRRWDSNDGRVWPTPWTAAEEVLPSLDVLILSHDDLLPFANGERNAADAILTRWSMLVPLLVATDGRHGATLFQQGKTTRFPAYPAQEVDPTGAGDVFAAAFLSHLHQYNDPALAIDFANCVASFSIEQEGIQGIPTLAQVTTRLRPQHPSTQL